MINSIKINEIKRKIFKQFPEFKGVKPKVTEKRIKPQRSVFKKLSLGVPKQLKKIYSMKFKKIITTTDSVEIERILVVTLDEQGEIIKITESK